MPFAVTAVVTVGADPAPLDESLPPPTMVFPIADAQIGLYGEQAVLIERFDIGEVVCEGPLAHMVRAQLRAGDRVIVAGTLELRASLKMDRDSPYVLLAIKATHIGTSLSAHTCEICTPE